MTSSTTRDGQGERSEHPFVSVVIPVYNDPAGIADTLGTLVEQTYPEDGYEVLVVDNGSTDSTREVVRGVTDEFPGLVSLLVEDEIQGSYAARNRGIEQAEGSLLAFVDADMLVPETYLEDVVDSAAEHGWDYMGCRVELFYPEDRETPVGRFDEFYGFRERKSLEEDHFTPTNSLVVRRAVVDDVGPFDERLTSWGDYEFGTRVYDAGYTQYFEPGITLRHPARTSLREFVGKYRRVGRGYTQLTRLHPERCDEPAVWDPRHYLPPNPFDFRRVIERGGGLSLRDAVPVYLVLYLQKLVMVAGRIDERRRGRTDGSRGGVAA
jgi:glycosyltransferase involved in cell wall biosynthesis